MTAYLIVQQTIRDADKLEEYRTKVVPVLEKYGGRFITKGGRHKFLTGAGGPADRVAIVAFPDTAALDAWYNSTDYKPLIALRESAVVAETERLIALEGA
jgi:uncharacterized protein (DUF1330 family)